MPPLTRESRRRERERRVEVESRAPRRARVDNRCAVPVCTRTSASKMGPCRVVTTASSELASRPVSSASRPASCASQRRCDRAAPRRVRRPNRSRPSSVADTSAPPASTHRPWSGLLHGTRSPADSSDAARVPGVPRPAPRISSGDRRCYSESKSSSHTSCDDEVLNSARWSCGASIAECHHQSTMYALQCDECPD